MALGTLAGALLAARRKHPRVRLVVASALGFGVAAGIQSLMPTYELYALMCIPVGLFSLTMMTAANTTIQMSTEPAMRGRVMSLYMMVFLGSTPIGSPIIGWISEAWSPRWSVGVGAIASILVAVAAAVWVQRNWHVRVSYSLLHRPHLAVVGPGERYTRQVERAERELAKVAMTAEETQQRTVTA
jgi:MFS family permease